MIDDWAERSLCPDGACTGVIGGDGRCKVCGRAAPFWGDERRRGTVAVSDDDEAPADAGDPVTDDDERALCPDGDCTGVLGDDGRCKECGKAGRPARAKAAVAGPAPVTRVVPPAVSDDEESDDRRLCPDGGCTGLLDATGVCKVCGQSAEAN